MNSVECIKCRSEVHYVQDANYWYCSICNTVMSEHTVWLLQRLEMCELCIKQLQDTLKAFAPESGT